jgi:hypothetical protein
LVYQGPRLGSWYIDSAWRVRDIERADDTSICASVTFEYSCNFRTGDVARFVDKLHSLIQCLGMNGERLNEVCSYSSGCSFWGGDFNSHTDAGSALVWHAAAEQSHQLVERWASVNPA